MITTRDARPGDAATLSALALRSKAHWGYSPEFMRSCETELTYRPDQITDENFQFVVAQIDQEMVGFFALETLSPRQFELDALFVEPKHIGSGVGRTLMQHAIDIATTQSAESILIQGDPNAEKFYLAAGAKQIGTRESGSIPGRLLPLFEISIHTPDEPRSIHNIPVLRTERLNLVPPSLESWEAYQRFYTDETASKMYGGPLSEADAWRRLACDIGTWNLRGFGVWVIQRRQEQDYVGTCGFWQGKGWPRELTWWLLPEVRGSGVATEASHEVIRYAYDTLGWETVETYMHDENEAARALTERLGGQQSDWRKFPDGLQRDVFVFPRPKNGV